MTKNEAFDFDQEPRLPRVLVVEDENRLRDMLMRAIPDMGFEVDGAHSAEEAQRIMEAQPHAILVLDLNLPGMSGLEFFAKVRETWPPTQVVVLTGFGDLEAAKEAIHLDVVEFLTKPCTLGDLEKALDRARRSYERAILPEKPALAQFQRQEDEERKAKENDDAEEGDGEATDESDHAKTLSEIERNTILESLERNDGNRQATARELGISVRTLYYRIAEYQNQGYLD